MSVNGKSSNTTKVVNDTVQVSKFTEAVFAAKKINANFDDVNSVVSKLFEYINEFNSIGEFEFSITWMDGIRLEDIEILSELKDFILPRSVRFDSADHRCRDLLIRPQHNENFHGNLGEFYDLQARFRGLFKSDAKSDVLTLADIRKDVSLTDIAQQISSNGRAPWTTGDAYVPIPVELGGNEVNGDVLFGGSYFNAKAKVVVDNYCDVAFRKLLK